MKNRKYLIIGAYFIFNKTIVGISNQEYSKD